MKKFLLIAASVIAMSSANASIVELNAVPSGWKLENYVGDGLVVWFTGSSCTNGQLVFPNTATRDDKNRLWSVITAAKVSNRKVFVRYDTTGCSIVSFGMQQ